jgi:hypothetical protein
MRNTTTTISFVLLIAGVIAFMTRDTRAQSAPDKDPYALDPAVFTQNLDAKNAALEKIRQHLVKDPTYVSPDWKNPAKIDTFLAALDAQGHFTDLNHPKPLDNWLPALNRLNAIAVAYHRIPAVHNRSGVAARLFAAIEYYCDDVVAHPDPFVGAAFTAPRDASAIFYSLYDELAQPGRESVRQSLKDGIFLAWYSPLSVNPTRKTDPFRVAVFRHDNKWTVGNFTYRPVIECAVAMDSTKMLDVIHAVTADSLANRTAYQIEDKTFWGEQGLLYDGGGFAHERQSYIFGYVRDWFHGVGLIAQIFRNTPWAIDPGSWDLLADHILDGQQWFIYQRDVDWSIDGRHNMYPGPIMGHMIAPGPLIDGNTQVRNFIKEVLDCSDGTVHRKDELLALDKRLADGREFSGNRYFWNSEDMVHRRPGYYLGVNISSIRSNGPESVAPFSVVNYHFPFGSMMIKTRGDEYLTSRGAINYSALPGITSDPTAPLPAEETWYGFHGLNDFCGGVSDGDVGVCGFIQKQKEFPATAHKSYFFYGDGMVALGSAISGDHLETTINQTLWRGPITYSTGQIGDTGGKLDLPVHQPTWILHDGVGYLVLPASESTRIKLSAETRQTRWVELAKTNATNPDAAPAAVPILQLSIPHDAVNNAYAYAVLPGATQADLETDAHSPPFTVLANTRQVQAVRFNNPDLIEAVFYEPATLDCGDGKISVDRAAVLLLRKREKNWQLYVSDPLQKPEAGQVHIETTLPGIFPDHSTSLQLSVALPAEPWIGSAARREIPSK